MVTDLGFLILQMLWRKIWWEIMSCQKLVYEENLENDYCDYCCSKVVTKSSPEAYCFEKLHLFSADLHKEQPLNFEFTISLVNFLCCCSSFICAFVQNPQCIVARCTARQDVRSGRCPLSKFDCYGSFCLQEGKHMLL